MFARQFTITLKQNGILLHVKTTRQKCIPYICHYHKISHKKTPIIHNTLTRHTRNSASGNGNKNPDKMLRNIDPGMANVCKLYIELRKKSHHRNRY